MNGTGGSRREAKIIVRVGGVVSIRLGTEERANVYIERLGHAHEQRWAEAFDALFDPVDVARACSYQPAEFHL